MGKLEFDPEKAIGAGLLEMDQQELCRFVARLCTHLQAELGSHTWRGGIFPENICADEAGNFAIGPAKKEKWSGQELEFVAPELYWRGETSSASDVYSLALLIYYGLGGGKLPFETATSSGQLARMSGKVLHPPKSAGKRLSEVLEKATAFLPEDRFESPEKLGIMLESCLDNKYLGGESGAEAVFKKQEGELSEIERMMVDIIERSGEDAPENEEEIEPLPEGLSPEEMAGLEKPDPAPVQEEDVSAMVEEFFGSIGVIGNEPEEPAQPEETEDVRVYEPDKKERPPIPILTVEENPELEPVVLKQQPRYSRNLPDPQQQKKAEQEVKKRRRLRPLTVVLILCALLLTGAILANLLLTSPKQPPQINPTPDPSALQSPTPDVQEQDPDGGAEEQSIVVPVQPRYTVVVSDMSWTEAREACAAQGGHLAVISTREEFEEIKALAEAQGLSRLWIGCHRVDGQLVWETDDPVNFSNWAEGEPSEWDDYDDVPEDYIMIYRVGNEWFYNDNRNDPAADYPQFYSGTMGYVCEFEN